MFKFTRNCQNVFQSSSNTLYSYWATYESFRCAPPRWYCLVLPLILLMLVGMTGYLRLILICIFLMANKVEVFPHVYWSFILWSVFLNILPIFYWFLSLWLSCTSSLQILHISPLSDVCISNILSHSVPSFSPP